MPPWRPTRSAPRPSPRCCARRSRRARLRPRARRAVGGRAGGHRGWRHRGCGRARRRRPAGAAPPPRARRHRRPLRHRRRRPGDGQPGRRVIAGAAASSARAALAPSAHLLRTLLARIIFPQAPASVRSCARASPRSASRLPCYPLYAGNPHPPPRIRSPRRAPPAPRVSCPHSAPPAPPPIWAHTPLPAADRPAAPPHMLSPRTHCPRTASQHTACACTRQDRRHHCAPAPCFMGPCPICLLPLAPGRRWQQRRAAFAHTA